MKELEQIHTRTYTADGGEVVVVVGTRRSIEQYNNYTEVEFVFGDGELIHTGIVSTQPAILRTQTERTEDEMAEDRRGDERRTGLQLR